MIERKAGENEVETALSSLTRMLEQHYGRPAILLIDEYDVPLAAASQNGYYREMMDVMRSVMSVLKDNRSLKLSVRWQERNIHRIWKRNAERFCVMAWHFIRRAAW